MRTPERASRRVAALDLGEVRTGVAISDSGGSVARPLAIVPPGELSGCLRRLVENEDVGEVVVGVPKTLSGGVGFQARRTLEELDKLREEFPEVRFVEWDERFTTRIAAGGGSRGHGKKKGRKPVDDLAAARMLQEYLYTRGEVGI